MPRQDQPGECVFERGLGLAEDILHKLSLKGIRCKTAVNCWGAIRERVNTTGLCMFFDEATSLGTRKARLRAHLRRRFKEERRNPLKVPLSAVCTVCTTDSKKSTGNLLIILNGVRGWGLKPEKQCTRWVKCLINAGRSASALAKSYAQSLIGAAVYDSRCR